MTWRIKFVILLAVMTGCARHPSGESVDVVVTNTLLEAAVHDLAGDRLTVMSLAAPGLCPGHFDLKPGQMKQLRQAKLIGLFDFQKSLAQKLPTREGNKPTVTLIHTSSGLALPATYLEVCTQLTKALNTCLPELGDSLQDSLQSVQQRMDALVQEAEEGKTANCPILCSVHQEAFLRWLGYDPVATFVGSDVETLGDIESVLGTGKAARIRLVVANEPEGSALAQALAEQLDVPMVVLANFPAAGETFDGLVRRNVTCLSEALHP